jgi:hypothetical protein
METYKMQSPFDINDNTFSKTSTLQPCGEISPYKVEVNFRLSIPDNLEHWKVFGDENKILRFLYNKGKF